MNRVELVGRITRDLEVRKTQTGKSYLGFNLAVNRKFKDENGNVQADFIGCVCWNQSADYLGKYAHKGDLISVEGSIQTRNYEGKNGKVYVTEVYCESVSILQSKEKQELKSQFENDKLEHIPEGKMMGRPGMQVGDEIVESDDLPFYGG